MTKFRAAESVRPSDKSRRSSRLEACLSSRSSNASTASATAATSTQLGDGEMVAFRS